MNLITALAKTAVTWDLQPGTRVVGSSGRTAPCLVLTLRASPAADPFRREFVADTDLKAESLLAVAMKEHLRDDPTLREWLDYKGNTEVELEPGVLDSLGEAMHTGLRKLADTQQSVLTWNALHHVHPDDRIAVWETSRELLTECFGKPQLPLRRSLAKSLKARLDAVLNDRGFQAVTSARGRPAKRTEEQTFALRVLHAGVQLTDIDEFMWGWLGYVVREPVQTEEPSA